MRPYIHSFSLVHKIVWVTDCSVGRGAQNSLPADVSYLQWYYVMAANYSETAPEHREIYRKVEITGACTGLDGDPLVQAILIQQRDFGHPVVDGKASVVHGTGFVDDKAFFVIRLSARFAIMYPSQWPRLDQIPRCPGPVMQASLAAVPQRADLMRR